MKKLLVFIMLFFSFNCYAETIILIGNPTEKEKEEFNLQYLKRIENNRKLTNAEIQRKHELDIEVAKFKNALMLERAGASNINVYSNSSSRNETNVSTEQKIKTVNK